MSPMHAAPAQNAAGDAGDAGGFGYTGDAAAAGLCGASPPEAEDTGPDRIYVLLGGRATPGGSARLDLVTLVITAAEARLGPLPEHRAILRLCRFPLSAAELSAHLRLPFSATAVLIGDLLAAGMVKTRPPRRESLPDPELIRRVLHGLERL